MYLISIIDKPYGWVEYVYKCPDCGGIAKARSKKDVAYEIKLNPPCKNCKNRLEHELETLYMRDFAEQAKI
jgi:hypothetical protein